MIAPGVRVADVPVGGLTADAAREKVHAWARGQMTNPITLTAPRSHRKWAVTVGDMGGHYDSDAAVDAAAHIGRDATQWDQLIHGSRSYNAQITPEFHFNEKNLDKKLAKIAVIVHQSPRPAHADYDKADGIQITQPEQRGVDLDAEATKKALMPDGPQSLAGGASANLVIQETAPAITESSLKRVDTLLASFHTDFGSSSENRRHNVSLAASHINGTLLAPGQVFSYNDVVGPREPNLGWRDAPTYQDGQVVPGPGGGVCQVSTTLYNAVLRANLPVVMRSHHSMPVHYVEPGRDATVAYGDIDFRFKNNTNAPLLISSPPKDGTLTFNLYGASSAKPGDIALESSGHTPTSNGGFTVTTYRTIRGADGTTNRERLSTDTYEPTPSHRVTASAKTKSKPKSKPAFAGAPEQAQVATVAPKTHEGHARREAPADTPATITPASGGSDTPGSNE